MKEPGLAYLTMRLACGWPGSGQLPEQLMMAIGFHHSPEEAPHHIQAPLIIQTADFISLIHCCLDNTASQDIEKIFHDCWPDLATHWQNNDLSWQPEALKPCLETLQKHREDGQDVLSIFTS